MPEYDRTVPVFVKEHREDCSPQYSQDSLRPLEYQIKENILDDLAAQQISGLYAC